MPEQEYSIQSIGQKDRKDIQNLQPAVDGIELSITGGIERSPMEKTPQNRKLEEEAYSLGEELELALEEGVSGDASDGNFTNLYAPILDGLGAVGEGAHAYHEKIYTRETLKRTALLFLLLTLSER